MNCKNCNKKLGCGCQKRTSKKGTACCSTCVNQLNASEASSGKKAGVVHSAKTSYTRRYTHYDSKGNKIA